MLNSFSKAKIVDVTVGQLIPENTPQWAVCLINEEGFGVEVAWFWLRKDAEEYQRKIKCHLVEPINFNDYEKRIKLEKVQKGN